VGCCRDFKETEDRLIQTFKRYAGRLPFGNRISAKLAKLQLTKQDKKNLAKLDMSRADRFVWKDGDVTITPPPPGDNTAEIYKGVDWAALSRGNDDEEEDRR